VKVYVEGGGDHNKALQTECRIAFSKFFEKAGLGGRMPTAIACGGRQQAYKRFRTAQGQPRRADEFPVLLVDSEAPIVGESSWEHVRKRPGDGWERPQDASEDQIQLIVQAMEAWFYADKGRLEEYYGQGFRVTALSPRLDIESIPKVDLFASLKRATKDCQKGEYSKGEHSFRILVRIDPAKVRTSSPSAARFLNVLDQMCTP
jgi:hypothetical protein